MRPGAPWGEPIPPGAPVVDVAGDDADLAAAALRDPRAVLRFVPTGASDLARALGLAPGGGDDGATVVTCDLLDLGHGGAAVNAVVMGVPPDRLRPWHRRRAVAVEIDGRLAFAGPATTVVIANGQFLRGNDVVPRGHPGDGRVEVQVYALGPGERRAMRRRLAGGDHVPHPRILQGSGRRVDARWRSGERPLEADGRRLGAAGALGVQVRPGVVRVLI